MWLRAKWLGRAVPTSISGFLAANRRSDEPSTSRRGLRVKITERHCEVLADTRERAESQVAALKKHSPQASSAEVIFMEERVDRVVEVIMHVDGSEPVVARAEDTEFRSALDKVLDRLSRQLKKENELRVDHQAPPRRDREGLG